ncbi:hypothetical protein BIV59_15555 [Bacillus sp. MUM 13]|nr:hypothetical protein BIV59_15555 [Bacillus sp. MUM 13]
MVAHKTVFSQCLSLLPTEDLACPLLNYDKILSFLFFLQYMFYVDHLQKQYGRNHISKRLFPYLPEKDYFQQNNQPNFCSNQYFRLHMIELRAYKSNILPQLILMNIYQ